MIHAIILSGGWGKRFWPKSRQKLPKQLLSIGKARSPLQNLFNMIKTQIPVERIWVVANKIYAQNLLRQLPALSKKNFLVEPLAKNTAAAVGLASVIIKRADPEAVTVVLSSDHIIGQKSRFLQTLKVACNLASQRDALITIGIRPHRATVEFGYLKINKNKKFTMQNENICKVERFVEKPDLNRARVYLQSKDYLWNSGIFIWKITSILEAMKRYLPKTYSGLQAIAGACGSSGYKKVLRKEYAKFKNISIDYGIMEKSKHIYTVVGKFFWQDLGTWAYYGSGGPFKKDKTGNVICGLHKGIDTRSSVIFSEKGHLIGTIGVSDLIVVHTPAATLVCKKDKAQEVKKLTELLEKDQRCKKYL